jgi:hypothetical protein
LIGAGAALIVALLAVALWYFDLVPWTRAGRLQSESASVVAQDRKMKRRARRIRSETAGTRAQRDVNEDEVDDAEGGVGGEAPKEPAKTEEEIKADEEEALVDAFDDLTDKWREPSESDVPMAEVEKFRLQFNKIPKDRQTECLQRALNLLPDENVMLLAGILLDKGQPAEYLELVYNDILNRDESVKKPLLKEIFKDREHPCWATTAWILDVTGELPGK